MDGSPQESDYKDIAESIVSGNCVLFLGAGASKGSEVPDREKLTKELWEKIKDKDVPLKEEEKKDLAKVAYWCGKIKGRKELAKYVKDMFPLYPKPLAIHKYISKLPFNIIVTTNYDTLMERQFENKEFESKDKKIKEICFKTIIELNDFFHWNDQIVKLIKIHGCVTRGDIVITEDDYIEYLISSSKYLPFIDILKFLFYTKNILFIGYSLSDINIKVILKLVENALGKDHKQHYLIQSEKIHDDIYHDFKEKKINIFNIEGERFMKDLVETFEGFSIERRIGTRFDFYLDEYRLDVLKYFEMKIFDQFKRDIEKEETIKDDYRFKKQLDAFREKQYQRYLIEIIKDEKNKDELPPFKAILDIITKNDFMDISVDIIISLRELLDRTENKELKCLLLEHFIEKRNSIETLLKEDELKDFIDCLEQNLLKFFIDEIKQGNRNDKFLEQYVNLFRRKDYQTKLEEILEELIENKEVESFHIEYILNIIEKLKHEEISEGLIKKFKNLLVCTEDNKIRSLILQYFNHIKGTVSIDDIRPMLENIRLEYESETDIGRLLDQLLIT